MRTHVFPAETLSTVGNGGWVWVKALAVDTREDPTANAALSDGRRSYQRQRLFSSFSLLIEFGDVFLAWMFHG
jgi:hypothetical protein